MREQELLPSCHSVLYLINMRGICMKSSTLRLLLGLSLFLFLATACMTQPPPASAANLGDQIRSCVQNLPPQGGSCDLSGFSGDMSIGADVLRKAPAKPIALILPAGEIAVRTTFTVPSNCTLRGAPNRGTTLRRDSPPDKLFIVVTGNNVTIRDLVVDGNRAPNGTGIAVENAQNVSIINNTIENNGTPTTKPAEGVHLVGTSHVIIQSNTFRDNLFAIVGSRDNSEILIDDNQIDSYFEGIHFGKADRVCSQITIKNNTINCGGFGVEIGLFKGASRPQNIVVTNNRIFANHPSVQGGISFDTVNDSEISHNLFDTKGFPRKIGGIEIVACNNVSVSDNTIIGRNSINKGISVNRDVGCKVVNNSISGFTTYGIALATAGNEDLRANNNVISQNTLSSSGNTVGIWVQANLAPNVMAVAQVNNNLITHNTIRGDSSPGSRGIVMVNAAQQSGQLKGNQIIGNTIEAIGKPFDHRGDANTVIR